MLALTFNDFSFKYAGSTRFALKDVSFKVSTGEFILLTGPSGCGKSTICRAALGLIPQSYPGDYEGEIRIFGLDPKSTPISLIAQKAGLVFQDPDNQLFTLSVERDVAFGPENLGLPKFEIVQRVDWALHVVEITHLRNKAPFELSGGQKQRVAIASILAMRPSLLILDEPTSFLDPLSAYKFLNFISLLRHKLEISILMIEHRLDYLAPLVDRVILMSEGQILLDGSPIEVFSSPVLERIGISPPIHIAIFERLSDLGYYNGVPPLDIPYAIELLKSLVVKNV